MSTATPVAPTTANLPESSITVMSPDSELVDQEIKHLVERQANAWETADSDKIVADFADDSLFIVPGSTFRGKPEIKKAAADYFAEFTETQVTLKRLIISGNEGAVEWNWQDKNRKTGEKSQAEDAIVFELEDGKIKYWREYIDTQPQGN
ncbi:MULTISPECIES: nuclear transport factor 2 family protein [unclassified Coleofasciculus]|uniref:nuclear transport factor 2 family protein n=1 Tax=unclassified Coleofasciculus TaxID=2692782 RepID=UPI00187F82BF|nr:MULTISPECIES: nuclear transport factor 2 family protein [unclassified Coleofasciculus]MBE9128273.1 nuclear transport factor 2 family protein [Coleofasciculus sp. LEGE 07081]MBE9151320.1 nuclear transport factor 2 family protein [Coleofasciculus sp. LEGE 07092]